MSTDLHNVRKGSLLIQINSKTTFQQMNNFNNKFNNALVVDRYGRITDTYNLKIHEVFECKNITMNNDSEFYIEIKLIPNKQVTWGNDVIPNFNKELVYKNILEIHALIGSEIDIIGIKGNLIFNQDDYEFAIYYSEDTKEFECGVNIRGSDYLLLKTIENILNGYEFGTDDEISDAEKVKQIRNIIEKEYHELEYDTNYQYFKV